MDEKLIVKVKFGSQLYGTATPESDTDYKGIYLPSSRDLLLNKTRKHSNEDTNKSDTKNTSLDVDYEIYSLHYFIKLCCEGQTGVFDMLHAPKESVIHTTEIWDNLVANRERFYSKNMRAFLGYARSQATRYGEKGSRLKAINDVHAFLSSVENPEDKLETIWGFLPEGKHINWLKSKTTGRTPRDILMYQVCGKKIHSTAKVSYALDIIDNLKGSYGSRSAQALINNSIDWKAVSHAVRIAEELLEIYRDNTITFPLKNAEYIKRIKSGQEPYDKVSQYLSQLLNDVELETSRSNLPKKADMKFWDNFILQIYGEKQK